VSRGRDRQTGSEVTLALVTVAVVVGFDRLFSSGHYLGPLLVAAVVGHTAAALTRRTLSAGLAQVAMLVIGFLVAAWTCLTDTLRFGIPRGLTLHRTSLDLRAAWHGLGNELAPTHATAGFVLASFVAIWFTAWMADRLAFDLHAPVESLVPATTVFLFVTLLSGPHHRMTSTILFGVAVLLFLLVERTERSVRQQPRLGDERHPTAWSTVRAGGAVAVAVVLAGALLVELVPGARDPGAIAVRSLQRDHGPRTVVSPLVDIRRRLVDQSNAQVFTVHSSRAAYWRLMALDDFDGTVWSSNQDFGGGSGKLDGNPPSSFATTSVTQTFTIAGLDDPWAPAAYRAASVQGTRDLLWDGASSTLIVDKALGSIDDTHYTVVSDVPVVDRQTAAAARGRVPADIRRRDTSLPDSLPSDVGQLARGVVTAANATTPYEMALALQAWFRTQFRYSLDVPEGQSTQAIEAFLLTKEGYCEQFAGTFAAMARSLGLPARVAVGFTPGEQDPADPAVFRVFGRNAHAWPEVFIAGLGWLPFEPTPGRGDPNAVRYTGVKPQQAVPGDPQAAGPAPTVAPPTTAPSSLPPTGPTTTLPALAPQDRSPNPPHHGSSGLLPWWAGVTGLVALAAAGGGIIAATRARARRHRRAGARSAADEVLVAWTEVQEAWAPLGLGPHPSETHREYAARLAAGPLAQVAAVATGTAVAPASPDLLARAATTAAWNPDGVTAEAAVEARERASALVEVAHDRMGRARRALYAIDPRSPGRRLGGVARSRPARRRRGAPVLGPRLSVSRRG
jgi:transglutaminase-like putative cysteine protease